MSTKKAILEPIRIGDLELKNRVVMAPLTRSRADEERALGELHATYYRQRSGAGLIVSEATQISQQGIGYPATPGIHTEAQVAGWKTVTDAVHEEGGAIFLQLWHVGRISLPRHQPDGGKPVAPSAVKPNGAQFTFTDGMVEFVEPRALETEEISGVVEDYANAARLAKEAGFDGVEIHAANGYLIEQFLHTGTNRRTDRYGGTLENRLRFLDEVTRAVIEVWGKERVGVRLSPNNTGHGAHDDDRRETYTAAATLLDRLGVAYVHVLESFAELEPEARLLGAIREAYSGVLIANAGYDAETGEAAIAAGEADAIAYGRWFISNPDLPKRIELGAPLAPFDQSTFYGGGAAGYTDYPALEE